MNGVLGGAELVGKMVVRDECGSGGTRWGVVLSCSSKAPVPFSWRSLRRMTLATFGSIASADASRLMGSNPAGFQTGRVGHPPVDR